MVNRRESLKLFASTLLYSALEKTPFAQATEPKTDTPRIGCSSCDGEKAVQTVRRRLSNVLDSASLLSRASLPNFLIATSRSSSDGIPVEYVDSATGNLSFAILDMGINTVPSVMGMRFYNSRSSSDTGLGLGWSLDLDERITTSEEGAVLYSGSGEIVQMKMQAGSTLQTVTPHLSRRLPLQFTSDGVYVETRPNCTRTYRRISDAFHLASVDYGVLGTIQIEKDQDGRMLSISHSISGAMIGFQWSKSQNSRLLSITDSTGRSVSLAYSDNLLSSVTDVTGAKWFYTYSDRQLTTVTDPANTNVLEAQYDNRRVSSLTTIRGRLSFAYSGENSTTLVVTDANGESTHLTHNTLGLLLAAQSKDGHDYASFSYDSQHRMQEITSSSDSAHRYSYDSNDRLVAVSIGNKWSEQTFNDVGRMIEERTEKYQTVYSCDSDGNPVRANSTERQRSFTASYVAGRVSTLQSSKRSLSFEYDANGQTTAIVDRKVGKFIYGRNQLGWLVSQQLPEGYKREIERNARGQITAWKDTSGRQFTYVRDNRGALTEFRSSSGGWVRAQRDTSGRITQLTNSKSQSRSFIYDNVSRLIEYRDAMGRHFRVEYDSAGKATQMIQKYGGLTVLRGQHGRDIAMRTVRQPRVVLASTNTQQPESIGRTSEIYDDGWFDPSFSHGLLGVFADDTVASIAHPLDTGPTDPFEPVDPDPGDGGGGDDGGGDDGGGGGGGGDSSACQQCESDYQAAATDTYNDCMSSAEHATLIAIALCTATLETGPGYLICVAAAVAAGTVAQDTCKTNYNNSVNLIPENCYSQCSGS